MTRNRFPLLLVLPGVVLAMVGCGEPGAGGPTPVRIGHFPNLTHAPAMLARARGSFEKAFAPRAVEWRLMTAGPTAIEAVFAGQLDFLYVGPGPAINGWEKSKGQALEVVAGVTEGGAGLVVRPAAAITTPASLSGKRIATPQTGNTQDIAFRTYLRNNGLSWTDRGGSVAIVPLAPADQMPLFQTGRIDGSWAVEPWFSRLVVEAAGIVLVDEATLWPGGRYPTTVLVARKAFVRASPDAVGIAAAVNRDSIAPLAAGDAAARQEVERLLLGLSGKSLGSPVLDAAWSRLRFDAAVRPADFERLAGDAAALGFLDGKPDLSGFLAAAP